MNTSKRIKIDIKNATKATAALCGSTLIAIAGCLACTGFVHEIAYADSGQAEVVYNNVQNISTDGYNIFSLKAQTDFNVTPMFDPAPPSHLYNNDVYGSWDESFLNYNCYAYALGKTDWCTIGDFSKQPVTKNFWGKLNYTIEQLKDYTVQDLKSLSYNCVTVEKNWFCEPNEGQTLICVRKSEVDFHFMKYVNGDWLHKPGNTWILKYKGVPSAKKPWYPECTYMANGVQYFERNEKYPYTDDIYFISYSSSHNYSRYRFLNKNQHEAICKNCESPAQTETHTFKRQGTSKVCIRCGFILNDNGLGEIIMKEEDEEECN